MSRPAVGAWNLLNHSFAAIAAGDLDLALATGEEGLELEEGMELEEHSAVGAAVLASALLETGQADRSVEFLLTRAGDEELRLIAGGWRAPFLDGSPSDRPGTEGETVRLQGGSHVRSLPGVA